MTTLEIFYKIVFDRWNTSLKNCDNLLNELSDETLMREIAPGKNRGLYVLGHLIAVHDDMLVLLDMGNKIYPELHEPFLKAADKTVENLPSVGELRAFWKNQCAILAQKFESLQPEQWMEKHTSVSAEDFAKEPHRNKFNIIVTRTTHLQYHIGQLRLLK
ncbi:MAG: DinB family protein [Bacteroidetes bacterium]|nr:DinB family protein [Bacteroidota bacterium]